MIHCCEAPRSMLSNYFGKKKTTPSYFWGNLAHTNPNVPLNLFEPKDIAFNLKNKVSAHELGLVVQLS